MKTEFHPQQKAESKKTLTNEGVVLIVDIKRKHKLPLLHFIGRIES